MPEWNDDLSTPSDDPDKLLTALKKTTNDLGRAPTPEEINKQTEYTAGEYANRYGSWGRALVEADLSPPPGLRLPDEHLLDELCRLADELEKVPAQQDMTEHGYHGSETYVNRFGSWSEAVEAAGLDARPDRTERARDTLQADIQRVAEDLGHAPTKREIETYGEYAWSTYYEEFGSWNEALTAADLEPRDPPKKIPEDVLLTELRQLAEKTEGLPTSTDMHQDGAFSSGTYISRFGSWDEALAAADLSSESA